MSKQLMSIEVVGKEHKWCFYFYADPAYLKDWIEDGLIVNIIENTVPLNCPVPASWWCFWQDVFNLKNPWRK